MIVRCSLVCAVLVLLCVASLPASAAWVRNGTALCKEDYDQVDPILASDGSGGAIVVWVDYGIVPLLYAQRVDSQGTPLWAENGVLVCGQMSGQSGHRIMGDGAGGAIIVWFCNDGGQSKVFAQHLDANGGALWNPAGVRASTRDSEQWNPSIVSDGWGGVIVAWQDYTIDGSDIYAQRLDADGNVLWGDTGIAVCDYPNEQYEARLVTDGSGGAICVWLDSRDGEYKMFGQRIGGNGAALWTAGGIPLSTISGNHMDADVAAAAGGGAMIVWYASIDWRNKVFVQKVDGTGALPWGEEGLPVCEEETWQDSALIVTDGAGGAIVYWYDDRDDCLPYAQRIDGSGNRLWAAGGVLVLPRYGDSQLRMIADGAGGALFACDMYDAEYNRTDIWLQRLDSEGNVLWTPSGVAACRAGNDQYCPGLIADGNGGAIVAWQDWRNDSDFDIYCQRIDASGLWGYPEPTIASCLDVPADQGGWVRVKIRRSPLDSAVEVENPIMGYNVWRRIAPAPGAVSVSAVGAGVPAVDRASLAALFTEPSRITGTRLAPAQARALGFPAGEWEAVGFVFAMRDTLYNVIAPTRNDSTDAGTAEETFVASAHALSGGYVFSQPRNGYSVDNIAPPLTSGFAGAESASPPGLRLAWTRNPAPDLWRYDIHRSDDELFVPDGSNRIGTTDRTEYHDATWVKAYMYFYKLVAVDRHGNRSAAALLGPQDIIVGALLQGYTASLAGSFVEISWTLSGAGSDAAFFVLRAENGKTAFEELPSAAIEREGLSLTCRDRSIEPGTAYRYRVDVADEDGRRMLFETQAITTPAMPLTLSQNHPNPFNPSTTIGFYLPQGCHVTLDVYDSSGKLVSRLLDGEMRSRGTHSVEWRGVDSNGRAVGSGVYYYRLRAGRETLSRKMVLMR